MSGSINGGMLYTQAGILQNAKPAAGGAKKAEKEKKTSSDVFTPKAAAAKAGAATSPLKLSEKAQAMLDKLKEKYGDRADIMVADYSSDEEASEIMGRGTKEFSILLTEDELEKMADDEEYEKENYGKIESAMTMGDKLKEQFSEDSETQITRFGISFNADGTTSFFAELEKVSQGQKNFMDSMKAQKEAEKEAREKENERIEARREKAPGKDYGLEKNPPKVTRIYADSEEALLEKLQGVNWSEIGTEARKQGGKLDFSV